MLLIALACDQLITIGSCALPRRLVQECHNSSEHPLNLLPFDRFPFFYSRPSLPTSPFDFYFSYCIHYVPSCHPVRQLHLFDTQLYRLDCGFLANSLPFVNTSSFPFPLSTTTFSSPLLPSSIACPCHPSVYPRRLVPPATSIVIVIALISL